MPITLTQVAGPFQLAEGPVFDGQALFFTDIPANVILRYDPARGHTVVALRDSGGANGLAFDARGRMIACEGTARRVTRYEADGSRLVLADRFEGKRFNSPNDVDIDPLGRIWFTDPRYGDEVSDLELGHFSVYRLDPRADGTFDLHRVTRDTTNPNGLAVSRDMKTLYVAQSRYGEGQKRELRAYPIAADGSVGEYRVLHDFYPHRGIDGMSLDSEGNIWAAAGWKESGPGPSVYVFAPDGKVLERIPVPVDRPTNVAFGDSDLKTLYVTTVTGYLFRARTESRGYTIYPQPR